MAYLTIEQLTELTGQTYQDTILTIGGIVGTFIIDDAVTSATGSGTVTEVGPRHIQVNIVLPEVYSFSDSDIVTGPSGSATVNRIGAATKPSMQKVQALIDTLSSAFDHGAKKYGVPIPVNPLDLDLLTFIMQGIRYGVAAAIDTSQYLQSPSNDSERRVTWDRAYTDFMQLLIMQPTVFGGNTKLRYSFTGKEGRAHELFHVGNNEIF